MLVEPTGHATTRGAARPFNPLGMPQMARHIVTTAEPQRQLQRRATMLNAPTLNSDELERYARHLVLREVGGPGQAALKRARVLVIGAGGLGAPALLYLAAAGVGTLGVVDDDAVSLSNLQRQVIHATGDVGRPKVASTQAAIGRLNPHVAVEPHGVRLTAANALDLCRAMTWWSTAPTILPRAIWLPTPAILPKGRW